ncbi:unnamed protein product, partial [Discosporangium mesarthrocarpum]
MLGWLQCGLIGLLLADPEVSAEGPQAFPHGDSRGLVGWVKVEAIWPRLRRVHGSRSGPTPAFHTRSPSGSPFGLPLSCRGGGGEVKVKAEAIISAVGRGGGESDGHEGEGDAVEIGREETRFDAEEEALRRGILEAEGPDRILREAERIPALRRLTDNALRITSATPTDGRLAALAIYRLGAAARSVVGESPPVAARWSSSRATGTQGHSDGGTSSHDHSTMPGAAPTGGPLGIQNEGKAMSRYSGGVGESSVEGNMEPPSSTASTLNANGAGRDTAPEEGSTSEKRGSDEDGQEEGNRRGGEEKTQTGGGAGIHAFDMEAVTGDQRFVQLLECIGCTSSVLSMSDMSKVVWGSAILGHRPERLLENLADILTRRLTAALSTPDQRANGITAAEAASQSGDPVAETEEPAETGGGAAADGPGEGHRAGSMEHSGTSSGGVGGTPTMHARDGKGEGGGVMERAQDPSTPAPVEIGKSEAGGEDTDGAGAEGEKPTTGAESLELGAVVVESMASGSDLGTAALSFSYAHARLGLDTPDLLDAIGACAKPLLGTMVARDVANIAWAFATQQRLDPELMEGIARQV